MMFDPDYDPYEELEKLKVEIMVLRNNDMQLATAYNTQNQQLLKTCQQLSELAHIQNRIIHDLNLAKNRLEAWIQLEKVKNETDNRNQ